MRPVPAALAPNCFGAATRAASRRLFGLAPDEVFRAADITIGAVGSYPAFSPLPTTEAAGGLIFCGTVRRKILTFRPRVSSPKAKLRGIAP